MARRLIAFALMALWLVVAVPVSQADTGDIIAPQNDPPTVNDGFQAGVCIEDPIADPCKPEDPVTRFFRVAGGHPPIGFTQYIVKQTPIGGGKEVPIGAVKTIRVDLPPGLIVNPLATETRCTATQFNTPRPPAEGGGPSCPSSSQVGEERLSLKTLAGDPVPLIPEVTLVPLYNLEPAFGEPARFGFQVGAPGAKKTVILETDVAWESDYHSGFTIHLPEPSPGTRTWKSRLVNFGRSGNGTYITTPTTCFSSQLPPYEGIYTTFLRAEAADFPEPDFPASATPFASDLSLPEGLTQTGCNSVPFDPGLNVNPGTTQVDSPAQPSIETTLPFITGGDTQSESHLRNASITLPEGMGLNPSAANGLQSCTDAQFGKGTRNPIACPGASIIGTAEVETPPLPAGALKGNVYLGQQLSRNPESGEEFRIFVAAESARYGISARLIGNTFANPKTGQLTAKFSETPQVPFTSVKVNLNHPAGVLSSPPTCSTATTNATLEPWSTPKSTRTLSPSFTLSTAPGGGSCPATMAERPFAPSYTAKVDKAKAGSYSPFRVHIGRSDGEQEIKGIDVTLPEGLTGKLKGIPYCPEGAIAAAITESGVAQQAAPACPASQIGTTSTDAGTGPTPLSIGGKAYLAGPYKGAPISMVVVTPALAGPFDLGNVIVRVALFVDPKTTEVKAVADPIPDVFGGVKLDLRRIDVNVDRAKFMRNATSCDRLSTRGTIYGGGADPTNPAAFSSYAVSAPYKTTRCKKLGFKPKLFTRLLGGSNTTQRAKHPALRAVLKAREGDANIARAALVLPRALFLDQGNIRTVCTRVQLAAHACPRAAVYGHAQAKSPLLGNPLRGPVYLVSSNHTLPDLVADLRGQVNIRLYGVISSKKGSGMKTVFNAVPDQPVSKFVLRMEGGKQKGLLINSRNLCQGNLSSSLNIKAQNGKKVRNKHLPLRVGGCGNKK